MSSLDFETAVIEPRKLVEYLLAPDHSEGGPKATFFLACGFLVSDAQSFDRALRLQATTGVCAGPFATAFGLKYVVEGPLDCGDGRARLIRSVWIVESGANVLRFVTAYPREAAS